VIVDTVDVAPAHGETRQYDLMSEGTVSGHLVVKALGGYVEPDEAADPFGVGISDT
jgi:hypothetical protein